MYLLTHSLLSSWLWTFEETDKDTFSEFVSSLKREKIPATESMIKGREFEETVCKCVASPQGFDEPYTTISEIVRGCSQQVRVSAETEIDGVHYLLYGIADFIGHGTIYDTKYTGSYATGKYQSSTQHPMYLRIVPEASKFIYLISNGHSMWKEEYRRENISPIDGTIRQFSSWLDDRPELLALYREHWRAS